MTQKEKSKSNEALTELAEKKQRAKAREERSAARHKEELEKQKRAKARKEEAARKRAEKEASLTPEQRKRQAEVSAFAETVGGRIEKTRTDLDLTQQDLAISMGISRATLGQWEIGKNSPSLYVINKLAKIMKVPPQWLAYGVRPDTVEIQYRSAAADNIHWIEEVTFGDTVEDVKTESKFGIPFKFLNESLGTDVEKTVICTINSNAVASTHALGDLVFVDTSDVRPSPAGIFAYWDGVGLCFAHLRVVPGKEPTVRIVSEEADELVLPYSDLQIIGRVKGRMHGG